VLAQSNRRPMVGGNTSFICITHCTKIGEHTILHLHKGLTLIGGIMRRLL
jgi:hypothetical protein